ncbi:hypothetical protein [Beijerinckia sp. L45]|uniref:hypothetical protein n=1 Tax=Beijerinckia sp. L45 TaxID=1641855 RepID=UPI00131C2E78|nr:hypothetical protein [Beijerinckia sp. L45]
MSDETLNFQVRSSSSDEIYKITATFAPSLKISCTCMGGSMGSICKHRTALLLEDASSAIDVNVEDLRTLSARVKASPLGSAIQEMSELEAEADKIKKKLTAHKRVIARLLNGEAPAKAAYAARY